MFGECPATAGNGHTDAPAYVARLAEHGIAAHVVEAQAVMLERPCPIIMVSSLTEAGAEETLEAMRLGAVDFIAKPKGAVSLSMDEFGPALKDKVRVASTARLPAVARLTESEFSAR